MITIRSFTSNSSSMKAVAHSPHLISTAEALRRVFLPPVKLQQTRLSPRSCPRYQLPNIQRRNAYYLSTLQAKQGQQPQSTGPPRDEAIAQREVQVVDPSTGALQSPCNLRDALASIDRKTNFLVQVSEKTHPRYAHLSGPGEAEKDTLPRIPVCRIVNKAQFRQAEAEKLRPKKDASAQTKEVEVNWAMSQNDLNHRLKRLKEFLDQGKRVEVVFGNKRKGWMQRKDVSKEEAEGILKQIRQNVEEVERAKEWKEMEGQVRGGLVMYFEAKREKSEGKREKSEEKKRKDGGYKVKKKFQAAHEERLGIR